MLAIESNDHDMFKKLRGHSTTDLNFLVTADGAFPLLIAAAKADLQFIDLMLTNVTIDAHRKDKNKVNAFFVAAYHNQVGIMRRLMGKGVDMHVKIASGSNALHAAIKRGHQKVVEELIRVEYDVNEPKVNGITPASIAAMMGKLKILELLHEAGADIEKTSPAGIGPLYLAIKSRKPDCAKFLIDNGAKSYLPDPIKIDYSPVFIAVTTAQVSILEMFCDRGDQLDTYVDSQGYTPLMLAAKQAVHDVVNYLTLRGNDLN